MGTEKAVAAFVERIDGFLEVEDERNGAFGWRDRFFPPFPLQAGELRLSPADQDYIQAVTHYSLDLETAASLVFYISDCAGFPARVRVELPGLPDVAVLHANRLLDTRDGITWQNSIAALRGTISKRAYLCRPGLEGPS